MKRLSFLFASFLITLMLFSCGKEQLELTPELPSKLPVLDFSFAKAEADFEAELQAGNLMIAMPMENPNSDFISNAFAESRSDEFNIVFGFKTDNGCVEIPNFGEFVEVRQENGQMALVSMAVSGKKLFVEVISATKESEEELKETDDEQELFVVPEAVELNVAMTQALKLPEGTKIAAGEYRVTRTDVGVGSVGLDLE